MQDDLGFRLPHFHDRCEGGEPLPEARLQQIRRRAQEPDDEGEMLRDVLDEIAIRDLKRQDKPGVPPESDRRIRELEALVAGLTTEVSQIYEKMEDCGDKLGELTMLIRRMDARDRRRVKAMEELARLHANEDEDLPA